MEYGAIDLHMRRSQIRILDAEGQVLMDRRIDTTRARFGELFGARAPMRVLIEASTEADWVAQCLEALGHDVIVADPNYTLMYGARARRIKTDKRDAAALAEACRLGIYRRAHRVSAAQQAERARQTVRFQLVRQRTALINLTRALLRQQGCRLPAGEAETVVTRVTALEMPAPLRAILAPLCTQLTSLTTLVRRLDRETVSRATADPVARQLMTAPGVGPIVALNFRAVLDDPARFGGDARRAAAFVGLVPREDSSAERRHKGRITKAGPSVLRSLLIQASWGVWRSRRREATALRTWAQTLAARRGRRIAIVALARRLCRALYAMWRDDVAFRAPTSTATAA